MEFVGTVRKFKEVADFLGDVPGIAAFVKVFFGEASVKKFEARIFNDVRTELIEDIALLLPEQRNNLLRRLDAALTVGKEDQLVWDICKINREVRRKFLLEWLNSLTDDEFNTMMELLHDDKYHQFCVRFVRWFKHHVGPAASQGINAVASGVMAAVQGADRELSSVIRQLRRVEQRLQRNIKAERKRKGWRKWISLWSW